MQGTKIKQDRAITRKPTTKTATEAAAADEEQATKKQEQADHKNHQPDSLERKSAAMMEEMMASTDARTGNKTDSDKEDASAKETDAENRNT